MAKLTLEQFDFKYSMKWPKSTTIKWVNFYNDLVGYIYVASKNWVRPTDPEAFSWPKRFFKGSKWNNKYPSQWLDDCYNDDDADAGLEAADITCTDNEGEVEGVYMMGFGTDIGT